MPSPLVGQQPSQHSGIGVVGWSRGGWSSGATALYRIVIIALAVLLVWLTIRIDLVVFGGVLLAIFLAHAAKLVTRLTGLPRLASLLLVIFLILIGLGAIGWFFAQSLITQLTELSDELSTAAHTLMGTVSQLPLGEKVLHQLRTKSLLNSSFGSVFGFASNLMEVAAAFIVIGFIGLYGAAEPHVYTGGLLRLVPPNRRARARQILSHTGEALWFWLLGRLLSMTVLGALTCLGLWLLGEPLPVALGLLAGLLTFVPYIGAWISAVPAVVLALAISLKLAAYVAGLYLVVHIVEGYILVPLVQRRAAHLPPALSLTAQVIFGVLAGIVGLLFATPLLAAIITLTRMIYVEDVLESGGGEGHSNGTVIVDR
jgi:predicted PurR-regulated permease PerM